MANVAEIDNAIWGLRASEVYVPLPFPDRVVIVASQVPTEASGAISCNFALMSGDDVLYSNDSGKSTVEIQGQSSKLASKANLKIKVKNAAKNKVSIRFGTWDESTSITFKGYGDIPAFTSAFDRSMVREAISLELWRTIRRAHPAPYNRIGPWYAWSNKTLSLLTDAQFSCDCRAVSIYFQQAGDTTPQFHGVFMIRSDNTNGTYLIDDGNPKHYLLQPQHGPADLWTNDTYLSTAYWEYSSPDTPDTKAPARLINWIKSVMAGNASWGEYSQYINLQSWIDYKVFCEATGSFDSITNNLMLVSYTASETQGIWSICAYDLDETYGSMSGYIAGCPPEKAGWVTDQDEVWKSFSEYFSGEIAARFADLRSSGVLSVEKLTDILTFYASRFRPADVIRDQQLYGTNQISNYPYILNWYGQRLAWLEQQWAHSDALHPTF